MSNGVEVIVAGDKSTYPGQASVLRVLPTSQAKPITLAPSTLTDHMLMMLPHPIKQVCSTNIKPRKTFDRLTMFIFTAMIRFTEHEQPIRYQNISDDVHLSDYVFGRRSYRGV